MSLSAVGMYRHDNNAAVKQPSSNTSFASKSKGLSRYEFVKQLGDGTFGAVHLYRTKDMHELVAIKV